MVEHHKDAYGFVNLQEIFQEKNTQLKIVDFLRFNG